MFPRKRGQILQGHKESIDMHNKNMQGTQLVDYEQNTQKLET